MADARHELAEFIIRRAFDPVLRASAEGRPASERQALERVQRATEAEVARYRSYGSAPEVLTNFKRDLHSTAAKKVHAELDRLHLPTLNALRDEIETKARELGVEDT